MGGYGSGYQGLKKSTVEETLTLSISILMQKRALVPGSLCRGVWAWSYPGEDPYGRVSYVSDMRSPEYANLRLIYHANGEPVDYVIWLDWTTPQFGGRRWWFLCPLKRNDGGPPRRVAKLHLPPGGRYFGSRQAYDLTYTSCQESGKHEALFASLARELGTDIGTIRRSLRRMGGD